ncbi:hypothetical protein LSTR_LSTR010683 [Laodelphax striatellus]|uniref:MARVEL domain-containing protein n=1 Tax=Laodelphax striatellus TaxID=195883 RepID=A0A482WTH4_LAOST|nr:hypothetical protein LSTR_LSTR010683 [Laodelphax striatellus]
MLPIRGLGQPVRDIVRSGEQAASLLTACCPSFLNTQFLSTVPGILKLLQMFVGGACQALLVSYGMGFAQLLGPSYVSLLTTASASAATVTLLLLCYVISNNTFHLIRSSLFELLFNISAATSYCSSSIFLFFAVKLYVYPLYVLTLGIVDYPAMKTAYLMGFSLSVFHAVDAYYSFKQYRGI